MTAIAGTAIGAAVLAGCASRPDGLAARPDKSAGGAIQFAAAQMQSAKSVHVHAVLSGQTAGTIDGSVVLAPTLQGDVRVKLDSAADAAMVPDHVIYDGKTVYAALPQGFHATAKSKPKAAWFAVDDADAGMRNWAVLKSLKDDPAALVKAALAKGEFAQSGSDTVDGVATTRFGGDVAGDAPGHVDVWLNDAGLPVELVFQSTAPGKQGSRAELHFSDWGKAVGITAPPAEEVVTAKDEVSFAISGQSFKVSVGDSNGGDPKNGLPVPATPIGSASGSAQSVCIQMPNLPTPASPSSTCVTVTFSMR